MGVMGPKQGDLEPPLRVDIADGSGDADLNTVVSWWMIARHRNTGELLFVDDAPVPTIDPNDSSKGYLTHVWVAGETDTPGVVEIACKAFWPGSPVRPQSFPNSGFTTVTIDDSITIPAP